MKDKIAYIEQMVKTYPQLGHAKNILGKYRGKLSPAQKLHLIILFHTTLII